MQRWAIYNFIFDQATQIVTQCKQKTCNKINVKKLLIRTRSALHGLSEREQSSRRLELVKRTAAKSSRTANVTFSPSKTISTRACWSAVAQAFTEFPVCAVQNECAKIIRRLRRPFKLCLFLITLTAPQNLQIAAVDVIRLSAKKMKTLKYENVNITYGENYLYR